MRLLLIEENANISTEFNDKFSSFGFVTDICTDIDSSYEILEINEYDCILTNTIFKNKILPKHITSLRKLVKYIPIIAYSEIVNTVHKINCLDNGADDYIILPFDYEELYARIRCHGRVYGHNSSHILFADDLSMNLRTKSVRRGNDEINLTLKEFAILEYLLTNKGMILSKEKIFRHVWDYNTGSDTETVKVYIRYLRKKIDDNYDTKIIRTVKNFGYTIDT